MGIPHQKHADSASIFTAFGIEKVFSEVLKKLLSYK
jgi:hypothetical protein